MKMECLTAKDIERGFSYIDGLVDAVVWKIGLLVEDQELANFTPLIIERNLDKL